MKKSGIVRRDTSLELVLDYIRKTILEGKFPPGTQLKQSVIASKLGVSQGPTREALIQLVSEGLVENIPFHGMFVRQVKVKDVEEIYQLRQVLEALALKTALSILKEPEHIAKLEQIIRDTIQAEEMEDYEQAVANDLAFHRYLVEASRNERLINFWNSLLAQAQLILRRLYQVEREEYHESMAKNHQIILEAIKSQDYDVIEHILQEHMDYACTRVIRLLQSGDNFNSNNAEEKMVESLDYA